MNSIVIKGRLTGDVKAQVSDSGHMYARFSVAVTRAFHREQADFFPCVAFGSTGEFVKKYFKKGQEILLSGEMECTRWTDMDGASRRSWAVVVRSVEFCGSRKERGEDESKGLDAGGTENPAFDEIEVAMNGSDLPF